MNTCPECNGEGSTTGFVCPGFKLITLTCTLCKGEKVITDEQVKWVEHGAQLKKARIAKRITLRESARLQGILASELSDIEFGRINNLHIEATK